MEHWSEILAIIIAVFSAMTASVLGLLFYSLQRQKHRERKEEQILEDQYQQECEDDAVIKQALSHKDVVAKQEVAKVVKKFREKRGKKESFMFNKKGCRWITEEKDE